MFCTYCGDIATTIDHVPPSKLRSNGEADGYEWFEVPSCWPCNIALGARPLMTVEARREWIVLHLQRRYRQALAADWTGAELRELGPDLRARIQQSMFRKASVERAIAFATSASAQPQQPAVAAGRNIFDVPIGIPEHGRAHRPSPRVYVSKPKPEPIDTPADRIRTRSEIDEIMAEIRLSNKQDKSRRSSFV